MCDNKQPRQRPQLELSQSDDCDDSCSSSSGGSNSSSGTFEGFSVYAARLSNIKADPDDVISHLRDLLDDVKYSTEMCHLCEWVDEASELSPVRCMYCECENRYCEECISEIYIEDMDDYCCRECAVDRATLAAETGKRVSVTTGRVTAAPGSTKRLKFTINSNCSDLPVITDEKAMKQDDVMTVNK